MRYITSILSILTFTTIFSQNCNGYNGSFSKIDNGNEYCFDNKISEAFMNFSQKGELDFVKIKKRFRSFDEKSETNYTFFGMSQNSKKISLKIVLQEYDGFSRDFIDTLNANVVFSMKTSNNSDSLGLDEVQELFSIEEFYVTRSGFKNNFLVFDLNDKLYCLKVTRKNKAFFVKRKYNEHQFLQFCTIKAFTIVGIEDLTNQIYYCFNNITLE